MSCLLLWSIVGVHGMKKSLKSPLSNQVPLNLGSPGNSGLILIPECMFESFYRQPPLYGHPLFIFFLNIVPMKYRIKTKINSCGKVIFSFLED